MPAIGEPAPTSNASAYRRVTSVLRRRSTDAWGGFSGLTYRSSPSMSSYGSSSPRMPTSTIFQTSSAVNRRASSTGCSMRMAMASTVSPPGRVVKRACGHATTAGRAGA